MNEIEKLEAEKKALEEKILKLKEQENCYYDSRNIRILNWDNKLLEQFNTPAGYELADLNDLIKLVNSGKIEAKRWEFFIVENPLPSTYTPLLKVVIDGRNDWTISNTEINGTEKLLKIVMRKAKG